MIYLDTSVALAQLLAEDRRPAAGLWLESLVASRLVEYELWTRLHARGLAPTHGTAARQLLARLAFVELARPVLARALAPFPTPLRTLNALHLASAAYLLALGEEVRMATYDERMRRGAEAMGIEIYPL